MKTLLIAIFLSLFALSAGAQTTATDAKKTGKPAAEAKKADTKSVADSDKLDLNTAKEEDLVKLPGIGDARAKAIVKGRPYKAKDDLVERKIISASVYEKIKDRIIAKQAK
jgi:competence protein ComEA